jgi:tetratricopeptide (TPR) repeat protein
MKLIVVMLSALLIIGCKSTTPRAVDMQKQQSSYQTSASTMEQSRQAFYQEDYLTGISLATSWIDENPDDFEAYLLRSRIYSASEEYEAAMTDIQKAASLRSDDLRPMVYKAGILTALNQYEEAEEIITKILRDSRFYEMSAYEKFLTYLVDSDIHLVGGRNKDALVSLEESHKIYGLNNDVFQRYGQYGVALEAEVYFQKSIVYFKIRDFMKSAENNSRYIELAQSLGKADSSAYKRSILALYYAGQIEECKQLIPNLSPQDRQDLYEVLQEEMFLAK